MKNNISIYHGTNTKGITTLHMNYGRFGNGVYFSRNKEAVKVFGKHIISININENNIKKINYEDLVKHSPKLSISEEEGLTNLKDFYPNDQIIEIMYKDGSSEIIIYEEVNNVEYKKRA